MGKTLGIIALIFGIVGVLIIFISFFPTPFVIFWYVQVTAPIVGIICGGIGIKKDDSPGLAIAGLVLGSIGLILWGISVVIIFLL